MSGFFSSNYNYIEAHREEWESDERTRAVEAEKKRHENSLAQFQKAATEDFAKETKTLETRISNLNYEINQLQAKQDDLRNTVRLYEMLLAQLKKRNSETVVKQKRKLEEEK